MEGLAFYRCRLVFLITRHKSLPCHEEPGTDSLLALEPSLIDYREGNVDIFEVFLAYLLVILHSYLLPVENTERRLRPLEPQQNPLLDMPVGYDDFLISFVFLLIRNTFTSDDYIVELRLWIIGDKGKTIF